MVSRDVPVGHEDFGKLFRCPNHPVEMDHERQQRLRKLSNLDTYANKTFQNFNPAPLGVNPVDAASLEYAVRTAYQYAQEPEGWLLLEGTYGCGKTHLAAAVGNERLRQGDLVLFMTTPDLLDYLRSTYGPSSEVGYDAMFDRIRDAQLLILDDLGAENPSPWAQEKLFQLLNYRYSKHLSTVITTNVDLDTLDPRIRSRLMDEGIIRRIKITAPDYRTPVQNEQEHLGDVSLYRGMTFENFDTETRLIPKDRENLKLIRNMAFEYAQNPQGWLVLMGVYGCGKTHLAAAIANYQLDRGQPVLFITVPELLDKLRNTFNGKTASSYDQRLNLIRNAPLLLLDDLNMDHASPWAKEKLFQIIDYRYMAQLPTVITTTKRIEETDVRISTRLMDKRRCRILAIIATDYASRLHR